MQEQIKSRPQKTTLRIIKKEKLTSKVFHFKFELPDAIDFTPGQFVNIMVERGILRSYSISNLSGTNFIETYVDISPNGPGSKMFLNSKVGDNLLGFFPLGKFVYKENVDHPVYFVATGTGIAPFLSMINHELQNVQSGRHIKLIFGVRYTEDLFLQNELNSLTQKYNNFEYINCISRMKTNDLAEKVNFEGRVTDYILKDVLKKGSDLYICGSKEMIADIDKIATEQEIDKMNIYFEQYY